MESPSLLHDNLASYFHFEMNSLDLESFKLLLRDLFTDLQNGDSDKKNDEQIKQLFDLFDQDKDGRLNERETAFMWTNWARKLQTGLRTALVIVDVQNDFISGSLPVPNAVDCVPVINRLISQIPFDRLVYTQDCHPADHISFFANVNSDRVEEVNGKKQFDRQAISQFDKVKLKRDDGTVIEQILWPVHCVQGSDGVQLHKDLIGVNDARAVRILKGLSKDCDSYSAFFDNLKAGKTDFDERLKEAKIDVLFVTGVATDYCVGSTTRDGLELGYAAVLVEDACRGIDTKTIEQMKAELQSKGCVLVNSDQVEAMVTLKERKFQIGLQLARRLFL